MSTTPDVPKEFYQRAEEKNPYPFIFRDYLNGDPIQTVTISSTAGPTVTYSNTTDTVTVWVTGGTPPADYSVVCKITAVSGHLETRKIIIHMLANHTT